MTAPIKREPILDLPGEEWRPVPGYEDYLISSCGRVQRAGKLIKPWLKNGKYGRIGLSIGGEYSTAYVHQLVLWAFVGPCPDGKECAHLDGNALNNRVDNLQWATALENQRHKFLHGTANVGVRNGGAKLTAEQVVAIRASTEINSRLARQYGVTAGTIYNARNGVTWKDIPHGD